MIAFMCGGRNRQVLAVALRLEALDQLTAGSVIEFDVDGVTVAIAAEPPGNATVGDATVRLTAHDLDRLRQGEVIEAAHPTRWRVGRIRLAAGASEHVALATLAAHGLTPDESIAPAPTLPTARALGRLPWREQLYAHPYWALGGMVALAGVLTIGVKACERIRRPAAGDVAARLADIDATARATREASYLRQALLDQRVPTVMALGLDANALASPCPTLPPAPTTLADRLVAALPPSLVLTGATDAAMFDAVFDMGMLLQAPLDLVPAAVGGVGPVLARVPHGDAVDAAAYRSTLVVDSWRDPRMLAAVPADGATTTFIAGEITGRLLVWGRAERRFVCASPAVTAHTPDVTVSNIALGDNSLAGVHDDALMKARLETVIAVTAAAIPQLRSVPSQ